MKVHRAIALLLFILITVWIGMACNNEAKKKENKNIDTIQTTGKKLVPVQPAIPDTVFSGFGTEPFWFLYVIRNDKIIFHPAEGSDVEVPYVTSITSGAGNTEYNSSSGNAAIELTIIKKNCSDGMSDETHPYTVALTVNKTKYSGCGSERN